MNRLRIEAKAMSLALDLLRTGKARIEVSPSGFAEFCFNGMRYCMNGSYERLISVIGWERCEMALGQPQ